MSTVVKFETEVSMDLEASCTSCGKILSIEYEPRRQILYVDPCEYCIKDDNP